MQLDLFDLSHGLFTEDAIEVAVVVCDLAQRLDVASIYQLADAAGIVHRLVLQRRETVVEHGIGDVQLAVFEFGTVQFVVDDLDIVKLMALLLMTFIESVAIVEHVIGRYDE